MAEEPREPRNLDQVADSLRDLHEEIADASASVQPASVLVSRGFQDSASYKAIQRMMREYRAGDGFFAIHIQRQSRDEDGVLGTAEITYSDFGPPDVIALVGLLRDGPQDGGQFGGHFIDPES